MQQAIKLSVVIGIVVVFSSGCSIRHVVSEDYSQYLLNNEGNYRLSPIDCSAEYILTPSTENHNYEFRAATVGYAHLWIVRFGEMLEKTLQSKDVQSAFRRLSKAKEHGTSREMLIKFNLLDYKFEGFEARVTLQITSLKDGITVLDETYFEKGISQGGKMFWAGPFGMKNAIQQSTKNALDKILSHFIHDMQSNTLR